MTNNGQPTPAQILEAIQNLQLTVTTELEQLKSDIREIRDTQLSEQDKLKDVFEVVMRIPDEMLNPPPSSQE